MKFRDIFKNKIFLKFKNIFKFKQVLGKTTTEFCQNTTLHGVRYVADKNLKCCERCFFGISIIAVIYICTVLILQVYHKWDSSPVIIGLNPKRSSITKEPFPAVTICNLNMALNTKVSHMLKNSTEYTMVRLLCDLKVHKRARKNIKNWNNLENLIINISQSCEDMILECRLSSDDFDCSELFHPIITDGGLCCVFNMLPPQYMYISQDWLPKTLYNISNYPHWYDYVNWSAETGYRYMGELDYFYPWPIDGVGEAMGLSVTLNVEKAKYYCSSANSVGFKFALHTPNEWPSVKNLGVYVEPGKETKIHITPDKTETTYNLRSIDPTRRGCFFANEKQLKFFAHYTQRNCEMELLAEVFIELQECIPFYMPKIENAIPICNPYGVKELANLISVFKLQYCLPSCNELNFHMEAFSTKLLHKGYHVNSKIIRHLNDSYVQDNIAVVHMFFKDHSFRTYKQMEFIGLADFISSIGGLMGLFIGFSFLSIAEVIYFVILRPMRSVVEYCKQFRNAQRNLDKDIRRLSSSINKSNKLRKLFKIRSKRPFKRSRAVFVKNIHTIEI